LLVHAAKTGSEAAQSGGNGAGDQTASTVSFGWKKFVQITKKLILTLKMACARIATLCDFGDAERESHEY
jgi:hypothetical protein